MTADCSVGIPLQCLYDHEKKIISPILFGGCIISIAKKWLIFLKIDLKTALTDYVCKSMK